MEPVSSQMGDQLAKDIGAVKYMECSVLTQKELRDVFNVGIQVGLEKDNEKKKSGGGGKRGGCIFFFFFLILDIKDALDTQEYT